MKKIYVLILIVFVSAKVFAELDSLNITVFFETDSINLTLKESQKLKLILTNVKKDAITTIKITAYCDDTGEKIYNDVLSVKRANYIQSILKSNLQLSDHFFDISGQGSLPINSNLEIEKQRDKNRKAEIIIIRNFKKEEKYKKNLAINDLETGEKLELNEILFAGSRHTFLPESYSSLDLLVKNLKENKNYHIKILGHVHFINDRENFLKNKDARDLDTGKPLSKERARAVYYYLIKNGINTNRLSYEGLGGLYPSKKGQKYDKRVEIEIIKK